MHASFHPTSFLWLHLSKASSLVKEARSSLRLDLYTGLGKLNSKAESLFGQHLGERKLRTDSPTGRSRSTGLSRVSVKCVCVCARPTERDSLCLGENRGGTLLL